MTVVTWVIRGVCSSSFVKMEEGLEEEEEMVLVAKVEMPPINVEEEEQEGEEEEGEQEGVEEQEGEEELLVMAPGEMGTSLKDQQV